MDETEQLRTELATLRSRLELLEQNSLGANNNAGGGGLPNPGMVPIGNIPAPGGNPGPFEPVFEEGKLRRVDNSLWPYGRDYRSGATVNANAKVANGFIGLKITHATYATAASAEVVLIGNAYTSISNASNSKTETTIPLYLLEDGAIKVDFRCLMSLAMRE
jgi:hypothetical protein